MDLVLDMASRRVLGFALGEHHDAQLAYGALTMAVAMRGGQAPGVSMHTGRRHSSLQMMSPADFEQALQAAKAA